MRRAFAALLLIGASAAYAVVPQRLNYQGKLGNAAGDPLSGTYSFRFKLFAAETGGAALFSEDVTAGNAVSVVNGIYTVQIGSYTAGGIPYGVFEGSDLYLEVDVNAGSTLTGAETLSPRERLNSAAWAVHALGAERLGAGAVIATFTATGQMTFPGPVTIAGSSLTIIHGGNTQPFSLAATSATDRSSYHLYVATTGTVAMGRAAGATEGSRLDVAGPAFIGGTAGALFLGGGGWPYSIGVGWAGQDSRLRVNAVGTNGGTADFRDFWVYDGKTNLIAAFQGSTGRFGIGTSGPIADLDVHKPAGSYPRMTLSDGNLTLPDYSSSQSVGDVSLTNAVGQLKSNRGGSGTNTSGGILIQGFTAAGQNNWHPMHLVGTHGGTAPTTAAVTISGQKHSGTTNRSPLTGVEPVFDVETNYGGTLLMRVQGGGSVGISTGLPQSMLDVNGNASFGLGALKSTFTATPGGTVYALQTSSGISVGGAGGVVAAFFSGNGAALTGITASDSTKVAKLGDTMTGQLTLSGSTLTVTGDAFSVGGSSLVVKAGNVGIGTTTPTAQLHVFNPSVAMIGIQSTGTATNNRADLLLTSADGGTSIIRSMSSGGDNVNLTRVPLSFAVLSGVTNTGGMIFGQMAAGPMIFATGGVAPSSERMRIDSSGNAGVGTTSPAARLHVSSAAAAATDTVFQVSSGAAAGQELLVVKGDGKVGVGAANPAGLLESRGTNGIQMLITNTAPANGANYWLRNTADDASAVVGLANEGSLNKALGFYTGGTSAPTAGTERMRITSAGNVGVGTATPEGLLDVGGSAVFGAGATKSTFTAAPGGAAYALSTSSGINVGGTGGVVASFFVGDGKGITGITAGDNTKVAKAGDTMTGQLTVAGSSITIVNDVATSSFSFAVTTATDRGVYHLYVATTGQVNMGRGLLTVGVATFVVVGGGASVGATNPAFIGASLSLQGRTFQVFNGAANAQVSIRAAANAAIWSESGNGFAGRRLFFQQHFGSGNQIIWRNASETTGATNQDNILVLTSTGGVGIGVQPNARLHVSSASTNAADNLVLVSTTNGAATTNLFRVQANGNVFAHGAMTGGGADVAEMYAAEPEVEPGDVVEFSPSGRLRRADESSRRVMGIISSNPGTLLGWDIQRQEMPEHRPLALAGRVPVKFSDENGAARRGDALTPASVPGFARRASPGELVIGSVLEDAGPGKVLAYVRSPDPHGRAELLELRAQNEHLRRDLDELRRAVLKGREEGR